MSLSSLDPSSIARESLTDPRSLDTQISQTRHRIEILKGWAHILSSSPDDANANEGDNELQAALGKCVLDIGCGQGDHLAATAALFKAQAEHAQGADKNVVIGVDPARLDYGSPFTLGEAQQHLSSSALGPHLSWVQADPVTYLSPSSSSPSSPTSAMLVHSIYYLPTASTFTAILRALHASSAQHVFLAEWSLEASSHAQALPHLLSVLLQSVSPLPEGNIRTVLTPNDMVALAAAAGWDLAGEHVIRPDEKLADGYWEASYAQGIAKKAAAAAIVVPLSGAGQDVAAAEETRSEESIKQASVRAHGHALLSAIKALPEGKASNTRAMDVWLAVLKRK